jgi:hypothetical protein
MVQAGREAPDLEGQIAILPVGQVGTGVGRARLQIQLVEYAAGGGDAIGVLRGRIFCVLWLIQRRGR